MLMKRFTLFFIAIILVNVSSAQLMLSGNSYTQDFNSIATLPTGWFIFTGASSTSLGNDMAATKYYPGKDNTWEKYYGEFREVASANASPYFTGFDSVQQSMATDRALAVRQVSAGSGSFPGSDSGAAFALQIGNPQGLTDFKLSFKLQSLDSTSPRVTTWSVDYGIGANPTSFTRVAISGDSTTGGNTYKNSTINIDFGTALNGQTGPVWIRIVALKMTTGSGNRTTTGIDDVNLTWTGNAAVADLNNTQVPLTAYATTGSAVVRFSAPVAGKYALVFTDVSGRIVYTNTLNAKAGQQKYQLNDLALQPGFYIVKMAGEGVYGATKVIVR